MKVDYIIVGAGLAGIAFCEKLFEQNRSFVVIDNNSQQASTVAGGLYNPVVLKRFTKVWKAKAQLQMAIPFYNTLAEKLKIKLNYNLPVYRLFASKEEQNNWFQACDSRHLSEFLSPQLIRLKHDHINCNFGFGKVLQTGRIDTGLLVSAYKKYLRDANRLIEETFDHNSLKFNGKSVTYNLLNTSHVIFAEGYGLKKNPFFKDIPLNAAKGELLTIHSAELQIDFILKSSVFLIPLGKDLYRVGATYEWTDKTNEPTLKGKEELVAKLNKVISCKYEIVEHVAGLRPTVPDRRPLVGQHERYKQLYVLNGLGTRGVIIAPFVADQLFHSIEHERPIDAEININRFD